MQRFENRDGATKVLFRALRVARTLVEVTERALADSGLVPLRWDATLALVQALIVVDRHIGELLAQRGGELIPLATAECRPHQQLTHREPRLEEIVFRSPPLRFGLHERLLLLAARFGLLVP